MSTGVNIGGTWRNIVGASVNIGGTWRNVTEIWCNIGGTWRKAWTAVEPGRLYHCDAAADKNYELNPDTLAAINTVTSPSGNPSGIGGLKG